MAKETETPNSTSSGSNASTPAATIKNTALISQGKVLSLNGIEVIYNNVNSTGGKHTLRIGQYPCATIPFTVLPEGFFKESR